MPLFSVEPIKSFLFINLKQKQFNIGAHCILVYDLGKLLSLTLVDENNQNKETNLNEEFKHCCPTFCSLLLCIHNQACVLH